jgi:CheY-like chemotaxis protein
MGNICLVFILYSIDGLKMIKEKKYDVVLIDLSMPVMSGEKVCEEIMKL